MFDQPYIQAGTRVARSPARGALRARRGRQLVVVFDVEPLGVDLVRSLRPQILALGAADERELDELEQAAREHLEDPDVVVMPSMMFLAWGRKPLAT
jgi:hypothetical protein